jgi:hypothetical protein
MKETLSPVGKRHCFWSSVTQGYRRRSLRHFRYRQGNASFSPHIGEAYERTGVAVISMGVNESDDGTGYDV